MKARFTNITLMSLLLLTTFSCKDKSTKDIAMVDETTEMEIPNISDTHFEMALKALQDDDKKKASEELDKGKQGLIDESGNVILTLKGKDKLDNALFALDEMSTTLKNGGTVDENKLRESMLNAELEIRHNYLVTEDVYALTTPKNKEENEVRDIFDNNMEALKSFNKDLKMDNQKKAKTLLAEGEQLNKEYDQWLEKVKAHNAKASDFLESEIFDGNLPLR